MKTAKCERNVTEIQERLGTFGEALLVENTVESEKPRPPS